MKRVGIVLMIIALALLGIGAHTAGAQESVVWSFDAFPTDGSQPSASLISDTQGNLYGTTVSGGEIGVGTVFELSPSESGGWTEKILYSFLGGNAGEPQNPLGSLVFDKAGNLYGTTVGGGTNDGGTVFELSPGAGGVWTEQTLYSFAYGNQTAQTGPSQPQANLIFDAKGNLYGTSLTGGQDSNGTVFELSPGAGGVWTEKTLYNFTGNDIAADFDGFNPCGGLIFDSEGNLYGTTSAGGQNAFGTVFELSPSTGDVWTEKQLWAFTGGPNNGSSPQAGLIFDSAGNLYGTTHEGGASPNNTGAVFELSPNGGSAPWNFKLLWSFGGGPSDGAQPYDTLIFDAQGNLYGTTLAGGPNGYARLGGYVAGTAFELSPATGGAWTETILHDFYSTGTDGFEPYAGLVADTDGNLYSTTYNGGANNYKGTVFKIAAAGVPSFSPPEGVYVGTQTVKIASAPADATIYYTTNGNMPTTASNKYTGPIEVPASETFKAFAVAAGYPNSAVVSAPFIILERPTVGLTLSSGSITTLQALTVGIVVNSVTGKATPTGSVTLASGSFTSAAATLSNGNASIVIPAKSLAAGSDTLTAIYVPDQASSLIYADATAAAGVTVQKVTPTITWPAPAAVTYGTALGAKQLDAAASVAGTFAYTPAPGTVPAAGTQILSVTFTPGDASQYSQATGKTTLIVNKAPLTVTASNATKVYGAALQKLAYTFSGFVNGDAAATSVTGAPSLTTEATATYNVGSYPIVVAQGTLAATNYSFTLVPGTLTITKAVLTVTANDVGKAYGTAVPIFSDTITGFLDGDNLSHAVTGAASNTTKATAASGVGTYPITPVLGTLAATDYTFQFVSGVLTVTPVVLVVTAANTEVVYGQPIPKFTYGVVGFVNGDTASVLSGSPTETTTAIQGSLLGTYPITIAQGNLTTANYTFGFRNGTLTILPIGTVATPTFTPSGGTYGAGQSVTIKTLTSGAAIYYTTDGTTPTAKSTPYSGPITIISAETLIAIASHIGYTNSKVASTAYTIIGSPTVLAIPATEIAASGATLNAIANTNGLAGTVIFQYGISKTALNLATASETLDASTTALPISSQISGLVGKTMYYFQAELTTAGGVSSGAILSFTTK